MKPDAKAAAPPKRGRKPALRGGRAVTLWLDADTEKRLAVAGNGNMSLGARRLVLLYRA